MSKQSWRRKDHNGCKPYNPECRADACIIYPYQNQKKTEESRIEVYDTS